MDTHEFPHPSGELTVIWQPKKCIHSGICVKTLPQIYHPKARPWIKAENASVEELKAQIDQCPSGALSYKINNEKPKEMTEIKHHNNEKNGEFEIYYEGEKAGKMTYTWAGEDKFIIDHTEVDPKFGGKGLAKPLVLAGAAYAKENNKKVIPLCPYAKSVFEKNQNIQDVLS